MIKTKKIIGMGLGVAILASSMSLAFAASDTSQSISDTIKSSYQSLVHFKGTDIGQKINPLSGLVTAGTITADQQKAIQKAMKQTKDSQKTMKESLDSLVTAGTITQAQEDAVIKAYDDAKAQMQAEQEKRLEEMAAKKGITVDELKAQMQADQEKRLEEMAAKKGITVDELKAQMQESK